ncbi:MAG: TIGR03667 family PPOX class F420-dependent oxidoreductase [Roseiflexaceae bacterium]
MFYDPSTPFGTQVESRLKQDYVIWLTTVRADGTPQPSPVWFVWDGASFLIYSRANTPKLRNIAKNPKVALNFNSSADGENIVVINGTAVVDTEAPTPDQVAIYLEKYREGIGNINMTVESFSANYHVAIRVTPTGVRGF